MSFFMVLMIILAIISFTGGIFMFCLYGLKSKVVKEEYIINNAKSSVKDFTSKKRGYLGE